MLFVTINNRCFLEGDFDANPFDKDLDFIRPKKVKLLKMIFGVKKSLQHVLHFPRDLKPKGCDF